MRQSQCAATRTSCNSPAHSQIRVYCERCCTAQLNSAIEELNQKTRRPLSRKVLQAIAAADPATNSAVHQLRIPGLSNKAKEQYGALLQPRLLILTGTCQRCMRRSKQQLRSTELTAVRLHFLVL